MDWSKTKTILIFALIITNIFLGVVYFRDTDDQPIAIDEQLQLLLDNKNVQIDDDVTTLPNAIDSIVVRYDIYKLDQIVQNFLGDDTRINAGVIQNDDYTLTIENRNELIVQAIDQPATTTTIAREKAIETAERYLINHGFNSGQILLDSAEKQDNYYKITYRNEFEDKFLKDSYMILHVHDQGVIYFKRKWLTVEEKLDNPRPIIPIEKAIYRFANQVNSDTAVKVEDIQLGYALENTLIENVYSGEALPFYVFILDSGEKIYIEALNN
jgi:regulatory protein YycI of two-component signal transduction system YycFG